MTEEKFENALSLYRRTVYGLALTMLRSKPDAEDVFQEVFLLYYSKSPEFETAEQEKSWLTQTAVNLCRRVMRSASKAPLPLDEVSKMAAPQPTADEAAVWEAVQSLKEKYRTTVYLYYFERMPALQIAKVMKVPESTVRVRLSRARKILRDKLNGKEWFDE